MEMWLTTAMVTLWRARAEVAIPKAVLAVCDHRATNRANADRAAAVTDVPASCRDQIKTSLDNCLKDPGITREDYQGNLSAMDAAQTDLQQAVQRQVDAYGTGKQKFMTAMGACDEEHKQVESTCQAAGEEVKTAIKENAGTGSTAGGGKARNQAADPNSLKLQTQLAAVNKARNQAEFAIDEQSQCFHYQADIYDEAALRARATLPSVSASPEANQAGSNLIQKASLTDADPSFANPEPAKPAAPASTNLANPGMPTQRETTATAWSSLTSSSAKTVGEGAAGLAGGKVFGPANLLRDGAQGNYTSLVVDTAGVGSMFSGSTLLKVVGGVPGTTAALLIDPSEANVCAEANTDPVSAKRNGCSVNLNLPNSSVQSAVGTLRSL